MTADSSLPTLFSWQSSKRWRKPELGLALTYPCGLMENRLVTLVTGVTWKPRTPSLALFILYLVIRLSKKITRLCAAVVSEESTE